MRVLGNIRRLILVLAVLLLAGSCETPAPYVPPVTYYYIAPTTAYLRSCPGYGDECGIVAQVFGGDRVIMEDTNDYGWSLVRLERSGAVGWIVTDLLTTSPVTATYYIASVNEYLRECSDYNCRPIEMLVRGDRVEKRDQDYRGWWRVVSLKSGNLGWIPVLAVSERPGPPFYYVNVSSLALRAGPSTANRIIATLGFNEQVEILGMGPSGWAKVRDVPRGIIGWVAGRYLEAFPVPAPRRAPVKKKAPAKKAAPEKEEAPKPEAPKAM
ncbi:MAG: SH3 domain-containing protein [Thermodesulfobacteriota bacterium]